MDPNRNPFSPGAGTPPPELVGREEILQQAMLALARTKNGRAEKSVLLVGLRGVGKTVLLERIETLSKEQGYHAVKIEAQENKNLTELLYPHLRQLLFALDGGARVNEKVKYAMRVLKSFVSTFKLSFQGVELSFDGESEMGTADSGDLAADLPQLFIALGDAAKDKGTAIAIIIDELQYLSEDELGALIMAVHRVAQKSLPIVVVGAGLPQLVGKAGDAKSYAERLFNYPHVGALDRADAKKALRDPIIQEGEAIHEDALDEIIRVTEGYPYFLQEWGYQAWNIAQHNSPITLDDVMRATPQAIQRMDKNFFRVRFDRLTAREKSYLRALADLGAAPQRSGDIADKMGLTVNSVAPLRAGLIKKGMIYSPTHGDTAFTVPLFDEFMKRIMPEG